MTGAATGVATRKTVGLSMCHLHRARPFSCDLPILAAIPLSDEAVLPQQDEAADGLGIIRSEKPKAFDHPLVKLVRPCVCHGAVSKMLRVE
jgi:hypothetical protein